MSIQKVNEIFVGNGTALDAGGTALPSIAAQIGIVGTDMTCLTAGDTIATANRGSIYLVNKNADGTFKRSLPIKGTSVTGFKADHYVAARRCVWTIGYQRGYCTNPNAAYNTTRTFAAAGGSIIVNADTFYAASIIFKNDKDMFSERPERLSIEFTSSPTATQSSIADQIVSAINNSAYGSSATGIKVVKAVKVGDGTGAYGLTGAANYGVEIWGLDVNQFANTTYQANYVYFSVAVDDATGFDVTTLTNTQTFSPGVGTYYQVYNMENKFFGTEGVLNRRLWPIPALTFLASSTLVSSANVAAATTLPTGNVSAVAVGDDTITVATATTGLNPGELIDINGVAYEILYILSATKFVLTTPATAVYAGGAALKVKYGYDVISLSVTDTTYQDGAGVGQLSSKTLYIATPAIDSGDADPFLRTNVAAGTSAEGLAILNILNPWVASTPLSSPTLTFTA